MKLLTFFTGIGYYFKGMLFLLVRPRLWKYVLIPWAISLFVFITICSIYIAIFVNLIYPWVQGLKIPPKAKREIVNALLQVFGDDPLEQGSKLDENLELVLLFILFGIIALVIFYVIQTILAKSFNEKLSCKVEELITGKLSQKKAEGFFIKLWQNIKDKLKSIKSLLFICFILFILNLIPLIGQAASFLVGSYYAGVSYVDMVWDRRNLDYERKRTKIKENLFAITGFGTVCVLLLLIPLINVFFMPVNIVGGTLLSLQCIKIKKPAVPKPVARPKPRPKQSR